MQTVKNETAQSPAEQVQAWREVVPTMIALGRLRGDPALQPRTESAVPIKERLRLQQDSEEHIGRMADFLRLSGKAELEPLLVAEIDGKLYIADGHHRAKAYRRERRAQVPCRVQAMTMGHAVLLSKLVNLDGVKLEMHKDQRAEALWQYLAAVTQRGALGLPSGESYRTLGDRFGPAHETARNMARRLPEVDPTQFSPDACDPGTGFPLWRFVKSGGRDFGPEPTTDERATKLAVRIGGWLEKQRDKAGDEVFYAALKLLMEDRQQMTEVYPEASEDAGSDF